MMAASYCRNVLHFTLL